MKLIAVVVLAIIGLVIIGQVSNHSGGSGSSRNVSLTERYSGQWLTAFDVEITRALTKNNVSGCGEYKFKASQKDNHEYLVRCTADGVNWQTYIVWPKIAKVMGPYATDPSMN